MGKKTIYIIAIIILVIISAGYLLSSKNNNKLNLTDSNKTEINFSEKQPEYVIEEIVPGQVISIKPIRNEPNNDNYSQSAEKVNAGVKEVGRKYRIKNGETYIQLGRVIEKTLYVEPLLSVNCTININNTQNKTTNETKKPDKAK